MTDPLSLLTLACAAAGGRVDDYEAAQLIAAGVTLLQRSAPLVRALSGRRSAILLPTSHAFLTAKNHFLWPDVEAKVSSRAATDSRSHPTPWSTTASYRSSRSESTSSSAITSTA